MDCRPADRIKPRDADAFAVTRAACELVGWRYEVAGSPVPVVVGHAHLRADSQPVAEHQIIDPGGRSCRSARPGRAGPANGLQSLLRRDEEFGKSGKFLTGAPLNKKWHKIPYRALREARVRVVDRGRNLIRRELRIPAGEALRRFGDQHSFIDLGHRDSLRPSRGNRQPQL